MKGFATGKGFYDPMKFTAAAIEWEKVNVEAHEETAVEAPVEKMPAHSVEAVVTPAVTTPAPAPKVVPVVKPVLKEGSKGADVKVVQKKLGLTVDGVFGPLTKKAVVGFQVKHDIEANGIVDETVWKVLG
jgi:peptidoglycan hydrolase-like protein with peptidoglycan-binding domain